MRKRTTLELIPLFFILISCGSGMTALKSSEFKKINSNFSGTFKNLSFKNIHKRNNNYKYPNREILSLFEINNQNVDSVTISFDNNNSLLMKYYDSTRIVTKKFNGKFSKKGFYEIYFRKKNIEIPPIIPIIYSKTNIDRIRISLSLDNYLLIDDYNHHSGNLLFLGAGRDSNSIYYFKPIKK